MVPCTAEANDVPKCDVISGNTLYAAHFGLYPPPPPPHTCPRHAANIDHNSEIAFSLKLVFSQIRLAIYTTCLTAVKTNTWNIRSFSVSLRLICSSVYKQEPSAVYWSVSARHYCSLKFTFSFARST